MAGRQVTNGCPQRAASHEPVRPRRIAARATAILIAALSLLVVARAANITISGSWSRTIGSGDLQGGAGSNLNPTYASSSNQVYMSVTTTLTNWRVDILRIDSSWNSNFVLSIRRTGNGMGSGTVSGGTNYQTILTTSQTLVTGSGNLYLIALQEQLGGVSVSIPVATYSTTIQYTAVDQ
jgi:hypothetical protein